MGKKEKKSKKKSKKASIAKSRGDDADTPPSLSKPLSTSGHRSDQNVRKTTQQSIDAVAKAIPINLGINISSNKDSNSSSGGWSWGAAFAAASSIRPNDDDLDEDFLQRATAASNEADEGGDGVGNVALLARGYEMPINKTRLENSLGSKGGNGDAAAAAAVANSIEGKDDRKIKDDHDDETDASIQSEEASLEGRMVSLSSDPNDQSLVLIDKQNGKVFSSGERMPNGRRLVIGKIVQGNIQLDQDAISKMKQMEESMEGQEGPSFPYPTNPDDHCETPLQSYRDILCILDELCTVFSKNNETLQIYDPYYCNGSVVKHLESLGYTNVYNRKEDCYATWKAHSEPPFDILLTNPPYSEDHIEKLMTYITSPSFGSKPFLLLMPNWVHKKDFYLHATTGGGQEKMHKKKRKRENHSNPTTDTCNPFYIVPKKRYVYVPPPDFRERKASDVHKKSSPFTSMWYVWGGTQERNEALMQAFRRGDRKGCELARSRSALRDLRRGGGKKKKARSG
ncbi:hypothetical protein HJC23_010386 [Cyclotella cryptica]|uniref:Uncharacterized protein n=1 Tax=Cyclotella cryptica TaxID=29204 RepID=A0ABD3QJP4_9STRA|eukprot:CCRYP_005234-RA/>CCRYP_005234-RA protein AED:0.00 eAED:0.00 QI:47/-1/1/1/-1/1/1/90/510